MKTIEQAQQLKAGFDLEGLKTDFPTATELIRFVYDETGISLNLKGRSNETKYQIALKVLNGEMDAVDAELITRANPYIDKTEMVPEDPIKELPAKDKSIPDSSQMIHQAAFDAPHPDPEHRAQDKKVTVHFRRYRNGMLTMQVVGPVNVMPRGVRQDKFGRNRPEAIGWDDPRTEERIMRHANGEYTPAGSGMKGYLEAKRFWPMVDKDWSNVNGASIENPWS